MKLPYFDKIDLECLSSDFMLEDNGNCVIQCPEGKYAKDKHHCEDCPGSCPKSKFNIFF